MVELTLFREEAADPTKSGGAENIVVVGDATMTLGFRLTGIKGYKNVGEGDVEETLASLLEDEGVGMIIVSERTMDDLSLKLKRRIEATVKPVVVAVPDHLGAKESYDSLREMIKRAIGFDIMGGG
ncbi:MAG: V-type ATP synthase subunit F [Methanobacteriota archaeon]